MKIDLKTHAPSILVGLALLLSFTFTSCQSTNSRLNTYHIRLALQEGDTYTMTQKVQQTLSSELLEMSFHQEFITTYSYLVKEIDQDNNMLLGITLDNIFVDFDFQGQELGDKELSNLNESLKQTLEKMGNHSEIQELTMVISPLGEVLDSSPLDTWLVNILENMDDEQVTESTKEIMQSILGSDVLEQSWNQSFGYIPSTPVTIGDTWSTSLSVDMFLAMDIIFNYTLVEVTDTTYEIEITGTLSAGNEIDNNLLDFSELEALGMKIDFNLSGESEGTMSIDRATGWILGSEISTLAQMTMKFSFGAESFEATMDLKQYASIE
jgi:hypothetical protein